MTRSPSTATASRTSPATWTTRARAVGRSSRRSTRTCPFRSSPPRSTHASPRARTSRSRRRSTPRCASSSAATPSSRSRDVTEAPAAENPLLEGLGQRRTPEPCVLVVFGASGDLTHRKIIPALYALALRKLLPEKFAIVGAAPSEWTDDEFRDQMEHAVREFGRDDFKQDVWDWLAHATRYISLDFADETKENDLAGLLNEIDEERGTRGNRVYYLAVPPQAMPTIVREVGERRKSEGWVRLIVENHALQLVALTAMEPPIDFTAESVRNEKVKVLKAIRTPAPEHVVRGQYGPGYIEGKEVPLYREEEGVDPASMTETFVAAKLLVDNWRWADTPIYLRIGKRLARRETTIGIQFKRAPHPPFEDATTEELQPNMLLVHVQPDEGVSLAIGAKVPGQGMRIRTVHMDFLYGGAFRTELPEAYERLLLDAMLGDQTLFTRSDEVEEQWALVDAIVSGWARDRPAFPNYAAGTWGPAGSDELMRRDGRAWLRH